MRAAKNVTTSVRGKCLLSGANSVSGALSRSFRGQKPAWKAGTLPTELLPQNQSYFSRKKCIGQRGVPRHSAVTCPKTSFCCIIGRTWPKPTKPRIRHAGVVIRP